MTRFAKRRISFLSLCFLFLLTHARGSLVQVDQISSPAGHVNDSQVVESGSLFQTMQPTLNSSGYIFGYWTKGNQRLSDVGGRSVTEATLSITEATTLTAHYFLSTEDTDGDGVMDWFEYRNFGDLSFHSTDDSDGDGFSNGQEDRLGQEPTIKDQVEDGGISSRVSTGFVFADTSMVHYSIKSDPLGFITGEDAYVEVNASVLTPNLQGQSNGYHFAYWSVNGVRQAGNTGIALSQVSVNVSEQTSIVAHYLPSTEDSDTDGVMDWFEFYQFGTISYGPQDDVDGDGFSNKREDELGQEASIVDQVEDGGISSRVSTPFIYADTSQAKITLKSNPAGFVSEVVSYMDLNNTFTTGDLHGESNGYHFAYWSVNGVRQAGMTGVSASKVITEVNGTMEVVAHYIPSAEDTDSDGVMDWFEMYQFGSLSLGPSDDPDGDGFSNKREGELGQEATIYDQVEDGGISSRVSTEILYYNQDYIDAKISGTVAYDGVVDGPAIVWALDENDTVVAQQTLPNGYGSFEIQVPKLTSYDFKVFIDGLGNGNPSAAAPWKHYLDWNASAGGFDRLYVDRDLSGIDFNLSDKDSDFDGFLNWHEHIAGTNQNDANSTPGLDFGLIAHWTFDETHGTTLGDSSGNDVNGTLHGFQNGWTAGRVGGALRFDGVDDYVSFPGQTQLDDIRPFSFSGWIKLDDNGSGYVLAKRSSSTGYWRFSVNNNMTWLVRKGTLTTPSVTYNYRPPDFSWQHIALSWSGHFGNSNLRIYHNGQLVSDATKVGGGGDRVSDANNLFTLGNRPQGNSSYFKGWMDDFRIWERVITPGEVDGMYTASPESNATVSGMVTHQGTVPGPVIVWAFDENGTKVREQILSNGPGPYTMSLPAGHAYDLKAFRDGNGNGNLDPSIGEPYAHWGSWNGDGFDLFPVLGDSNDTDIAITWEVDADSDGYTQWEEHVGGSDDNNASSLPQAPPEGLQAVSSLTILENQPVGTIIGEFNATDPDANPILTYTLVGGANDNHLFTLDANGTLRSAFVYDYENNQSFSIRVKVRDQYNLWTKEDFIVLIGNVVEDLDGDGIEDFYDADDDGDGFSDVEEIAYGSDPMDANSIANTAPQITLASTYPDNLDDDGVFHIGHPENLTEIIQITATDADGDDLNYSIYGWQDLHHFEINATTGKLSFKNAPDYEVPGGHNENGVYGVVIRVSDGYSQHDQPLWVWINDVNEAPYNLYTPAPLQVFENQPVGTWVGDFHATDPDANSTLLFSLSDENSSGQVQPFILDANGSLYTGRVFDYETDDQNYSLTLRVMDEHQLYLDKVFEISLVDESEYIDDNHSGIDDEDNSTIENPPEAFDFDLNGSIIAENQPAGTVVSTLEILRGNSTNSSNIFTFDLVVTNSTKELLFALDSNGTVRTTRVLDFEMDGPFHSISVRMSGEGNTSVEKDFQIQLLDQFKPIVRTGGVEEVTETSARLLAEILESAGTAEIKEWGILVSSHPDPFLEDNRSLIYLSESNRSTSFELSVQGLAPETDYFFSSFAVNAEGMAYGAVRKFTTLSPVLSPVWSDATPVIDAPGWWQSPWFGTFFLNDENGWVLHQGFGWVFILPQVDGIWIWHEELGWMWTSVDVYPFLYRNSTQDWVFFHKSTGIHSLVYDFGTRAWTIIP